MRSFRKLVVWQRSHELALEVYRTTRAFPRIERFGLVTRMKRCATSIPSNIAEGAGRGSARDYGRFLQIAAGSANELDYQLLLSKELGYIGSDRHAEMASEAEAIRRMLASLIRKVLEDSSG
ncbi:MAG: four helix bundle protein [Acidobacteria bacterium]|nr:four helix bundle protein [Acidobacteriota bacterium]